MASEVTGGALVQAAGLGYGTGRGRVHGAGQGPSAADRGAGSTVRGHGAAARGTGATTASAAKRKSRDVVCKILVLDFLDVLQIVNACNFITMFNDTKLKTSIATTSTVIVISWSG